MTVRYRRRQLPVLLALSLTGALAVTACNGEERAPASEEEAPESDLGEAELEAAVRGYSSAFLDGNADDAWDLLSVRCQDRLRRHEFAGIVATAPDLYGGAVLEEIVVEDLSGNLARVSYQYDISEISQDNEPWVFEDGWRNDDC